MSGFGTGFDEGQTKTYADLARHIKAMIPREVSPSAYEDVLIMFEALQTYLTAENDRLLMLTKELATKETSLAETERRLTLEKRALAIMPRSRDASVIHEAPTRAEQPKGRSIWGRRFTTAQG